LIVALGEQQFGIWMFLLAVSGIGAALNIGTSNSCIKLISMQVTGHAADGTTSPGSTEDLARSSMGLSVCCGAVAACCIILFFCLFGEAAFPELTDGATLMSAGITAAVILFVEQIDGVLSSILKGHNRFRDSARFEFIARSLQMAAVALVASSTGMIEALFAVIIIAASLKCVAKFASVKKSCGFSSLLPTLVHVGPLIYYAKWGWVHGVGGMLLAVADRIAVGGKLGSEALTSYSLLLLFPQQIHALAAAGASAYFPVISGLHGRGECGQVGAISVRLMMAVLVIAGPLALMLVFFSRLLFDAWIGVTLSDEQFHVFGVLCIAFMLLSVSVSSHFTLMGIGRFRAVAVCNLMAGVVSSVALLPLLSEYGTRGAAISKVIYASIILLQSGLVYQALGSKRSINEGRL